MPGIFEGLAIMGFFIFLWFIVVIVIPISVYSLVKVLLEK